MGITLEDFERLKSKTTEYLLNVLKDLDCHLNMQRKQSSP